MPTLQVRDLPQDLYDSLQTRAAQDHRSMAQQTIIALEEHLYGRPCRDTPAKPPERPWSDGTEEERQARIAKRKEIFRRIEQRRSDPDYKPMTSEEIVKMVREMREERTEHLWRLFLQNHPEVQGQPEVQNHPEAQNQSEVER